MKTNITMQIENALYDYSGANNRGIYGCFEVTLGDGYGDERVDFITVDSKDEFRCYEIKSSKQDFASSAKLSFVGDFNYFVIPSELQDEICSSEKWKKLCLHGVGLLLYDDGKIVVEHKAKRKLVTLAKRVELLHNMVRSLSRYCIYELQ